jgi:multiple sugar transport system substrate-binding protein
VTTDDRFGVQAPLTMPEWLPYLWQAGGDVLDGSGKKAVFNQPPGRDALQLMVDLVDRYQAAPPPDVTSDFVLGKLAMTNAWAGSLSMWTSKIQSFSWTTLPLPRRQRSATVLSGHAMTVLKDSRSQPSAGRFAQWFTSAPQLARFNSRTFTLPPRKSGQSQPVWTQFVQAQPRLKPYADSLAVARATPVHLKWQEMSVVIADAIVKAVKQEVSAQTALDDAARQVDALAPQG